MKHADLLIAAAAEAAGVTVLRYDAAYDRIAEVTGQATRWLAPKGSLRCSAPGARRVIVPEWAAGWRRSPDVWIVP